MSKRIGISSDGGKTCSLWCEVTKTVKGKIWFDVINGGWSGSIEDGVLAIKRDSEGVTKFPAQICWDAPIPKEHDKGYNIVMAYIDDQLKANNGSVTQSVE